MNLTLHRRNKTEAGIFGDIWAEDGSFICVTLEHSYDFQPKLPQGIYTCKRGLHRLAHMKEPFETFEILDVPGHSDILFHVGNYNRDSDGCVLIGIEFGDKMITESRVAFQEFMDLQKGIDTFTLTVL